VFENSYNNLVFEILVAAGVSEINASLQSGSEETTIVALENADVGLRGVTRECQSAYHSRLKETKEKKGQQGLMKDS
jgi:hypothetical protein